MGNALEQDGQKGNKPQTRQKEDIKYNIAYAF